MSRKNGSPLPLALCLCLCLSGCAAMLERSYSFSELYVNRYWDTGAGDTLRAGTYQDLVNSLLMLVDERAEEGTIRCYGAASSYLQVQSACREVSEETAVGSYLLDSLTFDYENGAGYSSVTCRMAYREDTEDPAAMMTLSDSQSLVDLLRLAVREEHEKQTARFSYNTPRAEVTGAVESLWRELQEDAAPPVSTMSPLPEEPVEPEEPAEEKEPPVTEDTEPAMAREIPPCPWEIRLYPDAAVTEIVEVLLVPEMG